ncbi:hypothetical protein TWF788_006466 [Orbilia oligospora]|uniref:Uncharacterized protein n=1 Tax=Orbilia oligospora TaxID=2813651 RepID=A0A7C8PVR8_ORBOL|nr:hypothetical protein TWF788_006466 [Orbilia oligospora]
MRHNVHYNPVHRPQTRPNININPSHDQNHCTWCHPPAKSKGAVGPSAKTSTSWEQQYEPICSNPYALELLPKKTSLSRQAVLNSMMLSSRNINTTPKMIESSSPSGEKVTIGKKTKSRRKGNLGWRDYNEEMDLDQARLINWENEQNFERHDVVFEEDWPTEDEVVYGEYLKTVFPEFRAALKERLRNSKGLVEADRRGELRDMGLLYDSNSDSDSDSEEEQERALESRGPNTPISRTPYLTPMSFLSDSDLDELWEIVEGRRLPVEMRGEWDIISEF